MFVLTLLTMVVAVEAGVRIGQVYRFKPSNFGGRLMRHRGSKVWIDRVNPAGWDTAFYVVKGLSGIGISLRSMKYPRSYLRHKTRFAYVEVFKNSKQFRKEASFVQIPGLAKIKGSISLRSVKRAGYYLRHNKYRVQIQRNDGRQLFKRDATWIPILVPGRWTQWSAFGVCSTKCGAGTQTRRRTCAKPNPPYCVGSNVETKSCNLGECTNGEVNGGWSAWSSYGDCSKTCGGGTQTRSRTCTNPAPAHGGASCPGDSEESETCNTEPCPECPWNGWCLTPDGRDQNTGVSLLEASSNDMCFEECKAHQGATGCEWYAPGKQCAVHTHPIGSGSGLESYHCWVFEQCKELGKMKKDEEEEE